LHWVKIESRWLETANVNNNKHLLLSLIDMKRITQALLLFAALLFVSPVESAAQTSIEALAYYPGDFDALNAFIKKELVYPKEALKKGVSGTVYIQFTVDSLGHTSDHKVQRGATPEFDAEALRVAKLINGFVPAKAAGKPVASEFVLPIKFAPETVSTSKGKSKKTKKK